MMLKQIILSTTVLLLVAAPSQAKMRSERDRLRAEAEHACYTDATTLCPDAIPDEAKITACMTTKRAQLSPVCAKVFDRGIKS